MNNLNKNFIDDDGRNGTMIASSDDNYEVKLDNYTLSNHKAKRQSALAKKFKNSILGADIGVKSSGFSSIAALAAVIAIAVLVVLYFIWRF
ncbi:MAG: hypothetical protein IKI04_02650 [Bacilli bacterium]|nr:hypothetical protein [Bacilli bacterium]